ncbi:MAG: ribose-phosphate pyrophosphokinase [Candidatus Omnitrophica bacterium]|nr:ribose-phosphate pyrophosphokinase [Candidatus Omnitrophota bacterium]
MDRLTIFSGNANMELAKKICDYLGVKLGEASVTRFSEGEISLKIEQNIRGNDVFIIQPTCSPPNDNLMELLIMIDALKRASAVRITAVIPYFGYARQDRKDQPRVPISAKLVANLITVAGANRVLTMDLHAGQIQGFFDIPLDNLLAVKIFVDHIKKNVDCSNLTVVSPDVGGIKMARAYAKKLGVPLAIVDKRRISTDKTEAMNILGEIEGRDVCIIDDIVATAGSLVEAVEALKSKGAKAVYAGITHPVISGPAPERLKKSSIKKIYVTDTIPLGKEKAIDKIEVLSVAPLLGEAIKRIHKEVSISVLFD